MPFHPNDIPQYKIDQARNLLTPAMESTFKTWMKLRDTDMVQMQVGQLLRLVAWYAELQLDLAQPILYDKRLIGPNDRLPEPSDSPRGFNYVPLLGHGDE